jgi:hypothetical protein
MLKKLKISFVIVFLLLVVSVGVFVILYSYTPVVDQAIVTIVNKLAENNIKVDYRHLSGNLLGTVRIDDLTVIMVEDTITCKRLELDYSLMDFLKKKFYVKQLLLIHPTAILHSAGSGTASSPDSLEIALDSLRTKINLEEFPFVKIDRLIIKDGNIFLKNPGHTRTFENIQLQLSALISDEKVEIQPKYARGEWKNHNLVIEDISFSLIGNKKRITLNQLEAKIPDANLIGHGEIEFVPNFRFLIFADTTRLEFSLIRKFWPEFPYREGYLKTYGSFIGVPGNFKGDAYLGGVFDSLDVNYLKVDYERKGSRYFLKNVGFDSNFGQLSGSAEISDRGETRVSVTINDVDFARMGFSKQPTIVNGNINLKFKNWDLQNLTGKGDIKLNTVRWGAAQVDTILLKVDTERGHWHFLPPSRFVFGPGSKFWVNGELTDQQIWDITVKTEQNSLDTLLSRLSLQDMGGSGNLDLHLHGPLADPSVTGTLFLDSLVYKKSTLYGVEGKANVTNVVANRQGNFDLSIATGFLSDVFLTSGEIKFRFNRDQIFFDPFQFFSEENSILTRGFVNFGENLTLFVLDSLLFQYENYQLKNNRQISAELFDDTLRVNIFSLKAAEEGAIRSEGIFAFNGNSNFNVDLQNIRVEPFNQYLYWDKTLSGYINANVDLFGELANPEITLSFSLNDLFLNEYPIGKLTGDFTLADKRLVINFVDLEGKSDSYFTVNGSMDVLLAVQDSIEWDFTQTPLDMNIVMGNWRLEDYTFLYNVNYPVEGSLTGRIDLKGNVGSPRGQFEIKGQNLRFGDYIFPAVQSEGRISPSLINIDLATVNFLNTILKLNGEKSIYWNPYHLDSLLVDKHFRLRVKVDEDSLNFLTVLNPELDLLTGDLHFDALVEGDYDQPRLVESNIKVENGSLFLSKLENSIDKISLAAHMEGQKLIIDNFSARSPKKAYSQNFLKKIFRKIQTWIFPQQQTGYISGNGNIDFTYLDRPEYDVNLSLNNAFFNYFLENTRIVMSSDNINIRGRDTISITGDMVINEADIEINFAESEKNLLLSTSVRETPPFLKYDFDVDILPQFVIRNNETLNNFDLRGPGDIRIIQEPREELEITGTLEISGKYFIQGEAFSIESGKIDFVNPKELPELNLAAQKQKNNLVFYLYVRGKLDNPEKEIVIQDEQGNTLPYPDVKDQMSLLLLGVPFNELGTNTDALLLTKGEQVVTQAIISTIEKEARTFTGLDQIRLDTQDSFFKNRLNQPATLALGKYLSPKLYFEYKARLESSSLGNIPAPSLSWEAGNQIYLQYRLNQNWSFYTIFQKTLEGNDKFNIDISWQISF